MHRVYVVASNGEMWELLCSLSANLPSTRMKPALLIRFGGSRGNPYSPGWQVNIIADYEHSRSARSLCEIFVGFWVLPSLAG